jgi:hypothetical protein
MNQIINFFKKLKEKYFKNFEDNRKCTTKCQANIDSVCCNVGVNPKKCSARNTNLHIGF